MRKYLSTLLVASVLAASCTKDAEVIREKIVSQSRPILSGQGQPENTKGEDGDYYLDLANADLYGPKTKGTWGAPALNLKGVAGKDGKDGANGTNGQNGATPRIGNNGNWWVGNTDLGVKAQGIQGQKGQDGRNGQDGQNGQNGRDGATPRIGDNGNWWVGNTDLGVKAQGVQGQKGQDGRNGQDGRDGQNGRDGATPRIGNNGNWWVGNTDLGVKAQGEKGQDGRNGQDGRDGQNGQPGRDGRDGATPRIGDNGNWWVGDQDTGKPARGEQGERGIPGVNGRDGNNGFTPYIGDNGNWWVDNHDTGKPARGENGVPGRNGENGQNGADGSKILAEDRAPQASDGVVGDYFIDKDAKIFYGPKTASGWPTTGISLTGNLVVTTDYELSSDGKTLIKWLNGQTRIIDMNADPKLKLVEKIGINAFNGQTNNLTYQLATIVIGERVREIERFAFAQCKKLKEVEIPEGITKIDSGTFSNCYNLSSVILPESLTVVGNGAFSSCIKLHTIVLPKNVNTVGNNAFKNCPNLHSIVLENKTAFQIRPLQFGTGNTTLQNIFVPQGSKSAYENLMTDAAYKAKLKEIGI